MEKLIKKLEQTIEKMGLTILDKWNDGFTYAVAIQHEKGVFIVYTTRVIYHYYKHGEYSFRLLQTSEHLPFAKVKPANGGDFITPYTSALTDSGKCIANYGYYISAKDLPLVLESAAAYPF